MIKIYAVVNSTNSYLFEENHSHYVFFMFFPQLLSFDFRPRPAGALGREARNWEEQWSTVPWSWPRKSGCLKCPCPQPEVQPPKCPSTSQLWSFWRRSGVLWDELNVKAVQKNHKKVRVKKPFETDGLRKMDFTDFQASYHLDDIWLLVSLRVLRTLPLWRHHYNLKAGVMLILCTMKLSIEIEWNWY